MGGVPPGGPLPPPSGPPVNPIPPKQQPPEPAVVHVPDPAGQVDLLDPAVIAEEVNDGDEENAQEEDKA
jgi:hypothetical protein